MTLDDQLAELRTNILRDRSDMISGDAPDWSWSDETLVRYIGDAERRFARRTLILRDATTQEVCQVRLRTGVATYPLHARVLGVLSARYDTAGQDLARAGHELVWNIAPPEREWFDPVTLVQMADGAPQLFYTDESVVYDRRSVVTLTVYPTPSAEQNGKLVHLRVLRLPLCDWSLAKLDRESEIPEDYQLDVLSWAAYRALRGFDADTGAPTSADAHRAAFESAVQEAIRDMKRKIFAPTPVRYGRLGWSW